jgi:HAMP domain-containing protein
VPPPRPRGSPGGPAIGLTHKILVFTSVVVVTLVGLILAHSTFQANRLARQNIDQALADVPRVWEAFEADRYKRLRLGLKVLGDDASFKAAIETGDHATVLDMLQERGPDVGADLFFATDPQGVVIARNDHPDLRGEDFSKSPLLVRPLEQQEDSTGLLMEGERLFHAAAVPMHFGRRVVGVLVAGFAVDKGVALEMKRETRSETAFVSRGKKGRVLASSLGAEAEESLKAIVAEGVNLASTAGRPLELSLADRPHLGMRIPLKDAGGVVVGDIIVLRDLAEEMAPFRSFRTSLIVVPLLFMSVALILAYLAAQRVTGPLRSLVGLVENARDGSYEGSMKVSSSDEIGILARAFDDMREVIAQRERKILHLAYEDPLTGLPNRALFGDRLVQALSFATNAGAPLSVLALDLEGHVTMLNRKSEEVLSRPRGEVVGR